MNKLKSIFTTFLSCVAILACNPDGDKKVQVLIHAQDDKVWTMEASVVSGTVDLDEIESWFAPKINLPQHDYTLFLDGRKLPYKAQIAVDKHADKIELRCLVRPEVTVMVDIGLYGENKVEFVVKGGYGDDSDCVLMEHVRNKFEESSGLPRFFYDLCLGPEKITNNLI